MKMYTTLSLQITLAAVLAGALSACGDKPPAAATADTPADVAPAAVDARPAPLPGQGLTAREMISAPPGSLAARARSDAAAGTATSLAPVAPAGESASTAPRVPSIDPRQPSGDDVDAGARYASVISVQPIKQKTNREECRDERIVHKHRPRDEHQIAGTVIGAVAGGVIGHQVGGGRGRDLATVAGAVGGGYAGRKIQRGEQDRDTYTTTERRCRTIKGAGEDVVAYDVVYEYLGQSHQVRLDHDPGDRIELPVRGIE